uniref:Uncharacterized protein n=1 Tax=Leersia perrieri TaxID=77586 RepID=A0A0D9WAM0_9ORYZ
MERDDLPTEAEAAGIAFQVQEPWFNVKKQTKEKKKFWKKKKFWNKKQAFAGGAQLWRRQLTITEGDQQRENLKRKSIVGNLPRSAKRLKTEARKKYDIAKEHATSKFMKLVSKLPSVNCKGTSVLHQSVKRPQDVPTVKGTTEVD